MFAAPDGEENTEYDPILVHLFLGLPHNQDVNGYVRKTAVIGVSGLASQGSCGGPWVSLENLFKKQESF